MSAFQLVHGLENDKNLRLKKYVIHHFMDRFRKNNNIQGWKNCWMLHTILIGKNIKLYKVPKKIGPASPDRRLRTQCCAELYIALWETWFGGITCANWLQRTEMCNWVLLHMYLHSSRLGDLLLQGPSEVDILPSLVTRAELQVQEPSGSSMFLLLPSGHGWHSPPTLK